jgi:DNA-directed RNA polymerase specialized sigma24 family protein
MQTTDGANPKIVEQVAACIEHMPDLPRKILALRYYEGMTLAEIALSVGLPQEKIAELHDQVCRELRAVLQHAA